MDYKDYYTVIGIEKSSSQDEIKRAYRKKAAQYHPDQNPDDKVAEQKFKELQEAYEVLKDPEKRKLYDQVGSNWKDYQQMGSNNPFGGQGFGGATGGGGYSDFFETIFGSMGGGRGRGGAGFNQGFGNGFGAQQEPIAKDVEVNFDVSLDEVFNGSEKNVSINGKQVKVKVPKGIEDGKKLKLTGKASGGADLYLIINTKLTGGMERDKANLTQTVLLNIWEAILGTTIRVKTLKGEVNLKIPELTKPDSSLRLKGFGLPKFHQAGHFGDLFVKIKYAMPERLTDTQKMLLKELKN